MVLFALFLAFSPPPVVPIQAEAPSVAQEGTEPGTHGAAIQALKTAPARAKVGRVRGMMAKSEVVFLSAPKTPYELNCSFAFPARSRMVLSGGGGSVERFQLGEAVFGRDVGGKPEAASYVLEGGGLEETLLDLAQRRAVLFWPGDLEFVGAGRTLSAKVAGSGILLATVDETTGLPVSMRSFDTKGAAGAEIKGITWAKVTQGEQPRPLSFTFAAGGNDLWTETVSEIDLGWHFTDAWFLPPDALTAVMGRQAEGQLRVAELEGAWVLSTPVESPEKSPATLDRAIDQACSVVARALGPKEGPLGSLDRQPWAAIVLDQTGAPTAIEYAVTVSAPAPRSPAGWHEVRSRTVWTQEWDPSAPLAFDQALESIKSAQPTGENPKRTIRLRMEFALEGEGEDLAARPKGARLTVDTTEMSELEVPENGPGKGSGATPGEDR